MIEKIGLLCCYSSFHIKGKNEYQHFLLTYVNSNLALKANASDLAKYYILAGGYTMYAQDDLNSYINVGVFHCATSDTAQYISNQPSSSKRAFRMVVEDWGIKLP